MLNFYYLYGIVWSGVFSLYLLSWSDFNKNPDFGMTVFFFISIICFFLVGYLRRSVFKYKPYPDIKFKHKHIVSMLIFIGFVADFVYSRQVPLISIISGSSKYMDFTGIPMLYVFLVSAAMINSFYLFYMFLGISSKREKNRIMCDFILMLLLFLLLFSRQMLAIIFFGVVIMLYCHKKYHKKILINNKIIFIIFVGIMLFLFLFGILGNLRSGFSWNDCSWIEKIGAFNSSYPAFLPKEFMWAYLYITNPLANLSHALATNTTSNVSVFFSMIPDFIAKRLSGVELEFWSTADRYNLVADYLNASTGFIDSAISEGYFGMCLYVFVQMFLCEISIKLNKNRPMCLISIVISDVIIVFSFFFNTLTYSGTSLSLIMCIVLGVILKKRFVFKRGVHK